MLQRAKASADLPPLPAAVRYLELLKGPGGQPPVTPLADIIALLEAAGGKAALEAGARGESTSGGGGSGWLDPAEQQAQHKEKQQHQAAAAAAAAAVPCTVIYCHRREDADRVAAGLRTHGIACAAYHAGLPDATRSRVLVDWQARRLSVVAATVAFGMGIDRAGGCVMDGWVVAGTYRHHVMIPALAPKLCATSL